MRNFIIIILFFFCGCYTEKKATEQLDKAQIKYPEIVAKKTSIWYPCVPKVQKIDSSNRRRAQRTIDSTNRVIRKYIIDTVIQKDSSICDSLKVINRKLNSKINSANSLILNLQKTINKPAPIIYRDVLITDVAKEKTLQNQIDKLQKEKETLYDKALRLNAYILWLLIPLALSIILNIYKFTR